MCHNWSQRDPVLFKGAHKSTSPVYFCDSDKDTCLQKFCGLFSNLLSLTTKMLPRSFQVTWTYTEKVAVPVQYDESLGTLLLSQVSFHNVLYPRLICTDTHYLHLRRKVFQVTQRVLKNPQPPLCTE